MTRPVELVPGSTAMTLATRAIAPSPNFPALRPVVACTSGRRPFFVRSLRMYERTLPAATLPVTCTC
jgi:hypothetical protein